MKKKIIFSIIIFLVLLFFNTKNVQAKISEVDNMELCELDPQALGNGSNEETASILIKNFGYTTNKIYRGEENLKFDTKITIIKKTLFNNYNIQIGMEDAPNPKKIDGVSKQKLIDIYGAEEEIFEQPNIENISWNVILLGKVAMSTNHSTPRPVVYITKIYSGSDYNEGKEKEVDKTSEIKVDTFKNITTAILNPAKTIGNVILNFLRSAGDVLQFLINLLEPIEKGENTGKNILPQIKVTQTRYDLENDGSNRNEYVGVEDYSDTGEHKKYINGQKEGFTEATEIPFIPTDAYNIALGSNSLAEYFDVNFLVGEKTNFKEGDLLGNAWNFIRNMVALLIRLNMYITAGFILISLIWHGINIVKTTIDNPEEKKRHRDEFERFIKSTILLVGTILIMALSIYAHKMIFDALGVDTSSKRFPIKVNVENAGYSFYTNVTGYMRYMAQIENVKLVITKAKYVLFYCFLVICNFVGLGCMVARYFLIMFLSIIGEIIVLFYAMGKENLCPIKYKSWLKIYLMVSLIRFIYAYGSYIIIIFVTT